MDTEKKQPEETGLVQRRPEATLPAAVQAALAKYKIRERPGVAKQWKPENVGEFILGGVRAIRAAGQFGGTVITLETPEGFQAVWLGADLKLKLDGIEVGSNLVIQFDGWLRKTENPKLKNDMRIFKVIEVLEPEQE